MIEPWQVLFIATIVLAVLLAVFAFGLGVLAAPVPWPTAFGESSVVCIPPACLWFLRLAAAVVFLAYFVQNFFVRGGGDLALLIYLTNWSNLLSTLYFVLLVVLTRPLAFAPAYQQLPVASCMPAGQPDSLKVLLALFTIQLPLSLIVSLLYWTLLTPIQDLCIIKGEPPCQATPDNLSLFLHAGAQILVLSNFLLGLMPFYLRNAGWFLLAALAYAILTYFDFVLGIGTPGKTCGSGTLPGECPIYPAIDWRQPEQTARLLAMILLVVCTVLVLFVWLIGAARYAAALLCRCCCWTPAEDHWPLVDGR